MVVAPCRRLVSVARWKGQAPHVTTGVARVSDSHCQPSTCSAGTIASRTTGTVSSALTTTRCRSSRISAVSASSPSATSARTAAGAGSSAV